MFVYNFFDLTKYAKSTHSKRAKYYIKDFELDGTYLRFWYGRVFYLGVVGVITVGVITVGVMTVGFFTVVFFTVGVFTRIQDLQVWEYIVTPAIHKIGVPQVNYASKHTYGNDLKPTLLQI